MLISIDLKKTLGLIRGVLNTPEPQIAAIWDSLGLGFCIFKIFFLIVSFFRVNYPFLDSFQSKTGLIE